MKEGIPSYRCKRCGGLFFDVDAQAVPVDVLKVFMVHQHVQSVGIVYREVIHVCTTINGVVTAAGIGTIAGMESPEAIAAAKREIEDAKAKAKAERERDTSKN